MLKGIRMRRRVRLAVRQAPADTRIIYERKDVGRAGDLTTRKAVRQLPSAVLSQLDRITRYQIGLEMFDGMDLKEVSYTLFRAFSDLCGSDRERYGEAIRSLKKIGEAAVPALSKVLKSSDKQLRQMAVGALGELRDKNALPALSQVLLRDPDKDVRLAAVIALQELKDRTAISALRQALETEFDEDVRRLLVRTIINLESVLRS